MADWTSIAEKFQKCVNAREIVSVSSDRFSSFSSRQLQALYRLHTTINKNKALFNLQLAATHIAFILDHDSDGKVGEVSTQVLLLFNKGPGRSRSCGFFGRASGFGCHQVRLNGDFILSIDLFCL